MRSITKFLLVVLAMVLMSSTYVWSQYDLTNEEIRDLEAQGIEWQHGPEVLMPLAPDGGRAVGDDCTTPIIINIPADLPFSDLGQTTLGRGNTYSNSCMGSYDGAEDIHYELIVTATTKIDFYMDPVQSYSGMALKDACGDAGTCIFLLTGSSTDPRTKTETLTAGTTYYLMIDTWPAPYYVDFDLTLTEWTPPPPPPYPVNVFPFNADFEDGTIPQEMEIYCGANADVYPDDHPYAGAYNASYGPTTSSGWSSPYGTGDQAFASSPTHHAVTRTLVQPSGSTAPLMLEFMMKMNWTYNANYNWFRVTVDETPVPDINGDIYHQAATRNADPYMLVEYDLSAYAGTDFIVALESCGKYHEGGASSYPWGDVTYIDDLKIYYMQLPGDLTGYVFNYDGLAISGATIAVEGEVSTTSGPDGSYFLEAIPYGMQEVYCYKPGYNLAVAMLEIPSGDTLIYDWTLTQPNMVVNPLSVSETLNPEEYFTFNMSILNNGNGPLGWTALIEYPLSSEFIVTGEETRTYMPDPAAEYSPTVRSIKVINNQGNRDTWDLIFSQPVGVGGGEAGFEANSNYMYTTKWNGAGFYRYDLLGNYIEFFTVSGASNIRDLAFDGTYFYGGAASNTCYEIDLDNAALISSWSAPTQVRAIGYNHDEDYFYANNWSSNITMFDRNGANLGSWPVGAFGNFYGFAYDSWTEDGPYLWGFSQMGSGGELVQMELPGGAQIFNMSVYPIVGGSAAAGGLFTSPDVVPGIVVIGGMNQNELIWCMELAVGGGAGNWLTMDYYEGTVPAFGGVENIPTHMDASGTESGQVYTADIVFTSDPNVGVITVPVEMIIMGDPLLPPSDLEVELVNDVTGEVLLTWTWGNRAFQYFLIRRDATIIGTTTNTSYTDILPDFGTYCYTVQAVYDEGQTAPAGPECVEWPNPSMFVEPDNLEGWVWVGFTVDVYTTISNLGLGTLEFTFPEFAVMNLLNDPNIQQNQTGEPLGIRDFSHDKGEDPYSGTGYPIVLGAGGPDDFGYVWIDSDEPGGPIYNFEDISATGTVVTGLGDDNVVGPFPTGITFPFYGVDHTQFWVQSNGMISFHGNYITLGNSTIPTGNSTYVDFIAWFWDDLDPNNPNTTVWYQSFSDKLIVQFDTYYEYPDGNRYIDAQVIMYKNGKILVNYDYIDPGFDIDGGTIGIQSPDPSLGLQVAYNAVYIHDQLALFYNLPADFIVAVEPAYGLVPENGSRDITITYDSDGYDPGDYTQELMLESNDPDNLEYIINNTMHVYVPAQFAGYVYDNDNSGPLPGVTVTAGAFQTMTAEDGTYELYVDEGSYDVFFEKLGYQPVLVADTFAAMGIVTPLDVGMWDVNYPPAFVHAEVMANDTWCEVTWALPAGPYEIQYDDGTSEDLALWQLPGSQNAVKFTPSGYPCTVIGGRIYVGDGSFPEGDWLGSEFGIAIYDDDGTDGLPGTMLDSGGVTVNNFGWIDFDWFSATFTEGDFYISMIQMEPSPNAAPIGIDTDNPTYFRSYSKFLETDWTLSAYQDFMIRAWVDGPEGDFAMSDGVEKKIPAKPYGFHQVAISLTGIPPITLPGVEKVGLYKAVEGVASRDVTGYGVARYSDFDPNFSPELGTLTPLATTGNVYYNDMAWAGLAQGWYAYGVRAHYTSGEWSQYAVSNIVGHLMDFEVTVNVTLSTGFEPINVEIMMQGFEYPYETYTDVTPASGTVVFDEVWKGPYTLTAYKIGYELYVIESINIYEDTEINIVLSEKKYPVTNLYVDPLTLIATWNKPLITAVSEDFEIDFFPPPGWQMTTLGIGWYRTDDGSSANWPVPTWDSYYAISNDDAAGTVTGSDGSMDYLITPQLDMRESDGYAMYFDSYYDGAFGQLAFVEYSYDAGATWEVLYQMPASTAWSAIELDLATFSGPTAQAAIWFAFHADDNGEWASGWCVDNVRVQVPDPAANYIDFHVFLDGAFVASTDTNTYNYAPLTYGVEYEASVAARYTSGLSAKDYYVFLCKWLIPPRNLIGAAPDDAALLKWDPPLEGGTLTLISEEPRQEFPNPVTEYSPMVRTIENNSTGTRDPWDLQFSFATADNSGEAGAESDGDYLYTTQWNGSGFHKYELDGTYVGPMSVAGIGSIRDLAYDPTTLHMFGGAASTTVYEMDFATQTQIGTFNAPVAVRAIAYDPDWDGFWANNWSDNITLFDKTGAQLNSFPVGSYGSYYGFAHDMWTVDGPYLWGFSQDGGNTIVQIEIATGLETGETHDVNGILFIGTGIAGGLFTHPNLVSGFVTIGGNSQNDTYFGYELAVSGPQPGLVPDNLLGYNMYRDEGFVFYQDHVGGLFPEQQFGVEEGLDPGIYAYTVTGVYDLTKYGLPGETGESMEEGPAIVVVDFCFELEFMEDWDQGSFENNNWTEQSNWSINGQVGNPAPAAEFTWDPIQTEYELSLTSYPLCASGMSEGNIWLDFDLKHESYNHTGEEFLLVQVWNWDNDDWFTVLTYSNLDGSFDWMSVQKDIKAYAMGKVFKIRFQAQGMNSLDILSWYVDNIHVYRTCAAPTDLTAEEFGPDYDDIKLTWVPPAGGLIDEWFHYDDGVNFTAIGTGAAAEFDCAARWEPAQLVEYAGTAVTEIAFFPAEALCEYHVRVWVGAGAANMVVDQVVASPLIGQWNYITLDTPVPIDITQDLWVGYYVNTQTGYPAGCDAGPAIDGFGNMMNFGGWQTLLQINPDLDYNWNIQARVVSVSGDVTQLSPIAVDEYENAAGMEFTLNANYTPVQPVFAPTTGSRLLTGFNIYRSDDGMPYDLLDYVEDLGVYEYIDEDLTAGVIYCYKVTAIFTSDLPDMCESDFSNEACDYVTVGVDELGISSFAMYPNPAVDYVAIESSDELKRVTVYNTLGQLIMDEIVSGNKYELSTSSYTVGSYMVRVETEKGVSTSVLTVQR